MKSNQLLKHLFATTAVLATLTTTAVTTTAHAASDTDSYTPTITNEDLKQYASEHGYKQPEQNPKTTVDSKSKKYGYSIVKYDDLSTVYQYGKYPSQMQTIYNINGGLAQNKDAYTRLSFNNIYIEGVQIQLWSSGLISVSQGQDIHVNQKNLNQQANFLEKHGINHLPLKIVTAMNSSFDLNQYAKRINVKAFYRKLLHVDIDKVLTNTQPKNWKTKYANGTTPKGFMQDGYSKTWLSKKLDWIRQHHSAAQKEMHKIIDETTLKDQRMSSATNNFDNTTIK